MRFQCSYCRAILAIDDCQPGEAVACGQCGNAIAVPESRLSTGSAVGDFVIQKELGQGGMGSVYLAHQVSLDRPAALKVLHSQFSTDESYIADFVREARAAASINHPNIVQAFAVGSDEGLYYFAMEYVEGSTLKQVLLHGGRMVPERALAIAQDVAEALEFAWSTQQLVHRDIKPDNIILTSTGKTKLADLGLARKFQSESVADLSEELQGTPQYISPEQLLGYPGNNLSDIYSLGATLYHTLTGQFPFLGDTPADIAGKHITESLLPAAALVLELPDAVSILVENMTAKRPADRYANTGEVLQDLGRVRQGEMPARMVSSSSQIPIDLAAGEDIMAPVEKAVEAVVVDAVPEAVAEAMVAEGVIDEPTVVPSAVPSAVAEGVADVGGAKKVKISPKPKRGGKLRLNRNTSGGNEGSASADPGTGEEAAAVAAVVLDDEGELAADMVVEGEDSSVSADSMAVDTEEEPDDKGSGKGAGLVVLAVVLIGTFAYFGYAFFVGGDDPSLAGSGGVAARAAAKKTDALKDELKDVQALIASEAPEEQIVTRLAKLAPDWGTEEEFIDVAAPYVENDFVAARTALHEVEANAWGARTATLAEEARLAKETAEKEAQEAETRRKEEIAAREKEEEEAARLAALKEKQEELRWNAIDLCKANKYSDASMLFVRMTASRDAAGKSWAASKQECIALAEKLYKGIYNSKKKMAGVKYSMQNKDWVVAHVGYRYIEMARTSTRYDKGKGKTETSTERIPFEKVTPQLMYRLSGRLWEIDELDAESLRLRFGAYLLSRGEFLRQAKKQLTDHPDPRAGIMLAELEIISPKVQKREFAVLLEELQLFVNQGDRKRVQFQVRKMKALCPDEFAAQEEAVKKLFEQL